MRTFIAAVVLSGAIAAGGFCSDAADRAYLSDAGTQPLAAPEELPHDLRRGLVARFSFDEDPVGELLNAQEGGKQGTPQRKFAHVRRGSGKALELHGHGQHGDEGGHALLPFVDFAALKQFTVALWVREYGMSHEEGEAYITYGIDRGVGVEDSLGIAHLNSSVLFRVGEGHVSIPFRDADRDRWVHYALTFAPGRMKAYRNGRLVGETAARVSVAGTHAGLGRHWWGDGNGTSARFQGALDDVRIYDLALDEEQLRLVMGEGE